MILIKLFNTLGRSDLESMEIADKVSTAVTPDELNVFLILFLYGYIHFYVKSNEKMHYFAVVIIQHCITVLKF